MDRALEEIEFLALSPNRIAVLNALRDAPATRRELGAATGASQPTLGRILRDFDDRNWIVRTAEGYDVTATGRLVAAGFTDLREIVETELTLRDVVAWLPTDEMDFDLLALRDATITVPSQTRPGAPVSRVTDTIRGAETVRIVSHAFNERSLETIHRHVRENGQRFEGIFSTAAIDALADEPSLSDRLRELLETDRAEVRVFDGDVPHAVTIADDVLSLMVRDDDGVLQAALDTDNEQVRTWGEDLHERYWERARPLEAADLE
ncbi:IclR family transcriptional regulator [Halostagnicola larsenii XH-48]|uniref:IclR family transcriptional regulator n=1 Tax=Halostagnicola larsenii XH-48 TaxID=797299 RepID=W0JT02_9EURY|nr:transcriptional regulator FilR1 domain-containing protein [Halostagnicola larsenii]AHG00148.1 IclR family transcriptional regulator [Halostagnicola larsenii XH-48]